MWLIGALLLFACLILVIRKIPRLGRDRGEKAFREAIYSNQFEDVERRAGK